MAIKNTRNTKSTKNTKSTAKAVKKTRPVYEYEIKVLRAFEGKYGILCDLSINNVTVYGCRICTTKTTRPLLASRRRGTGRTPKSGGLSSMRR